MNEIEKVSIFKIIRVGEEGGNVVLSEANIGPMLSLFLGLWEQLPTTSEIGCWDLRSIICNLILISRKSSWFGKIY